MGDAIEAIARDEYDASAARAVLWPLLEQGQGSRTVYATLTRWVWRVLIERRLDDELRAWHRLLLDTAGFITITSRPSSTPAPRGISRPDLVAERLRGLADIIRLSIDAASATLPVEFARRAHVREILRFLAQEPNEAVDREAIRRALGFKNANLSRIMTLLAANGLVERLPRGREAMFRATQRGLSLVAIPDPAERERARNEMPPLFLPKPTRTTENHSSLYFKDKSLLVNLPSTEQLRGHHARRVEGHEAMFTGSWFDTGLSAGSHRTEHRSAKIARELVS